MKPTPEQIEHKQYISEAVSNLKTCLINLYEADVELERGRILLIVRDIRDMDEMTNAQIADHLEWAIKGGDDD
jgi:hypothetical protein